MLIFCPEKSGAGVSRPAGSGGDIGAILAYLSRCCRVYAWGLRTSRATAQPELWPFCVCGPCS
jgi:hypothetical protein